MKTFLSILCILSIFTQGCYTPARVASNDNYSYNDREVSYQTFYDQLQPYGNWIDYPGYGYVWQPNAGMDFRPYETNGRWVSTVDGWAWASDYNWGWAPFHYGRWLYEPAIGWAWVPGYEWAPAWVTWGQYNDYYAWAPLAPGINISIGNSWRAPYNYWSFIPRNYIQYSNPDRYVVRNNFNSAVVNNITIINNYNSYNNKEYYHRGPDYHEVEQYTHRSITPVAITTTQKPGAARFNQRQFEVYRPTISPNSATNNHNAAPSRVRTINEITANGGIKRAATEANNNGASSFNPGVNQNSTNSTNTGTKSPGYRNPALNNGVNGGYNNSTNATGNTGQASENPARMDRNERMERLRQNSGMANPNPSQAPDQQQPQNNQEDRAVTPPVRRFQQRAQDNRANNSDRGVMTPTQPAQINQPSSGRWRDRIQQTPSGNENDNQNQNRPVFQNNRNIERNQNIAPQNNNGFRGQPNFSSPARQGAMPSNPSGTSRNVQQVPAQQNPAVQRANRARERP